MTRAVGVEAVGIGKHFGGFHALSDVSLKVTPGSVHGLLGENGAGKSTLVKCLLGYYRADAGSFIVDGREVAIERPADADALGLGMVYQHFTLVPSMTVAENLVMSRQSVPAVINWRAEIAGLRRFMERMPFKVPLEVEVGSLAAGERQKTEIIKQLYLVEVLGGQRTRESGTILVDNTPYDGTQVQSRAHDVRVLPEEPLRNG